MIKVSNIPVLKLDTKAIDTALLGIAKDIKKGIKTKTGKGLDYEEQTFAPYSTSYKKYKQKLGKGGDVVNLVDTGKMMQSITINKIENGYRIEFADKNREAIASYHNYGMGNNPKRAFFSIGNESAKAFYQKHFANVQVVK